MTRCGNTLALGIGNTLLSDEGAGVYALKLFQEKCSREEHLTFLDGGTLNFTLAPWIEDCDHLIVFDAAALKQAPGTVNTFTGEAMDAFLGSGKRSAHEVGLLDLLHIARLTGRLPEKRALIGIQAQSMGWGLQPTQAVQNALPLAVDAAFALLKQWRNAVLQARTA